MNDAGMKGLSCGQKEGKYPSEMGSSCSVPAIVAKRKCGLNEAMSSSFSREARNLNFFK